MDGYIDCYDIVNHLDIQQGDKLMISSDIVDLFMAEKKIKKKFPDSHQFIDSFIQKIGPSGTLLFPTYNWDFCHGGTFDIKKTPSKTGILGQSALEHPGFKRTKHPIYSFAVWGKDQEYLCSLENKSSFGPDSPFAYMDKEHVKNLIIGIPPCLCFTFTHYVEESSGVVNYRFLKDFTSKYIDENKEESLRTYSMFVRHLDMDVVSVGPGMDEELKENGILKESIINNITFTMVDLHGTFEPLMNDILHNRSRKICTYKGQNDE